MARTFETVLLDVDGTLVDSNDAHARAWAETLAEFGFAIEVERIRPLIGVGGDKLVEQLTGIERDSDHNAAIGKRRSAVFMARWIRGVRPLPGSRALLLMLREGGYRYAIASAAQDHELAPLLEIAEITDLVDVTTTSSDVQETKPDPEIVRAALAKLGAKAETAVMIGDTPYDIAAATDAGVACIAVESGGWKRENLAGAFAVYRGVDEIAARHQGAGL